MKTLNSKLEIYRNWRDSLIFVGQEYYDYFDTIQSYIDFADYYHKKLTEETTSEASKYDQGYKEGYKRAIELSKLALSNLIPPYNEQ